MRFRTEKDSLGKVKVPAGAYYGSFTARASNNFKVSNLPQHEELLDAYIKIKIAAAKANLELKSLDRERANAIIRAAKEFLAGKFDKDFLIDVFQAGAGTATNMNINEILANRASEILNHKKGGYFVHPNDHVNRSQSTNDTYPSAARIAALALLKDLIKNLESLNKSVLKKSRQFKSMVKSARTHLQDAVPITLGQEFHSYYSRLNKNQERIKSSSKNLHDLPIGGTAVGTGFNTKPRFRNLVVRKLKVITGLNLRKAADPIEGIQSATDFLAVASSLKELAISLSNISRNLQLLSSGPNTGFNEIKLPEVEPGSSIMPGKINPSMLECLDMICYQVIGNTTTIETATRDEMLDLNIYLPVIAYNLLQSIKILTNGINTLTNKCINGIKANKKVCDYYFGRSAALATVLAPHIGYVKTAEIVKESLKTCRSFRHLVLEKKLISKEKLDKILNKKRLTGPNL